MSRLPGLNWTSEPLLLVRDPNHRYGTITIEEYTRAGRHAAVLDVVAIVPREHAQGLLQDLPVLIDDLFTVVWPRRSR